MCVASIGPDEAPERFALLRRLGSGRMGVVYEAFDRELGRRLALKTLAPEQARYLPNLQRELRLVRRVEHPNVVRLLELFECADTWALAQELVEGTSYLAAARGEAPKAPDAAGAAEAPGAADATTASNAASDTTLRAAMGSTMALPIEPVGSTVAAPANAAVLQRLQHTLPQLGSALLALHTAGLIHCDVKPSNAMVTPEGRVVLLDFGLARSVEEPMIGGAFAGTPAYMAPEQTTESALTAAADCYAVGVILYQVLAGRLPFVGALADLFHYKRTCAPPPPSLLAPDIPPRLEALCLRLLDPDPAARPTAAELAAWVA